MSSIPRPESSPPTSSPVPPRRSPHSRPTSYGCQNAR